MIKIEKNKPMPQRNKYPFRDMNIGDSFLFPAQVKDPHSAAAVASRNYAPKKFAARVTPEGVRCWRVQ